MLLLEKITITCYGLPGIACYCIFSSDALHSSFILPMSFHTLLRNEADSWLTDMLHLAFTRVENFVIAEVEMLLVPSNWGKQQISVICIGFQILVLFKLQNRWYDRCRRCWTFQRLNEMIKIRISFICPSQMTIATCIFDNE